MRRCHPYLCRPLHRTAEVPADATRALRDVDRDQLMDISSNSVGRPGAAGVSGRVPGATVVIRAYGACWRGSWTDAVKSRRLASNPARGVENLARKTARRHVYLSAADVGGWLRGRPTTGAGIGPGLLRYPVGGSCGVAGSRCGFSAPAPVGGTTTPCSSAWITRWDKRRAVMERSVPVPAFVLDELAEQCRGAASDDLVFGDGSHYLPRPKTVGGWFAGAVKRAKVQKITPHDLRHTCASLVISSGVKRVGVVPDARAHLSEGHLGHLQGLIRHRSRCGCFSA